MLNNGKTNVSYNGQGVAKSPFKEISFKASLIISGLLHFLTPALVSLFIFILALLGINLLMFNAPKPKMKDIEFKIVHAPEQKPLVDTKNRAERDTRAGGKNNPKKPESDERSAAPKAKNKPKQVTQKPQPKPKPKAKPKPKQKAQRPQPKKPQPKKKTNPTPPMPRPVAKAPKPKAKPNPLAPPVKIASAPRNVGPQTKNFGPVTKNRSTSSNSSGATGPAPVTLNSPAVNNRGGSSSGGYSSRPSRGSHSYGSGGAFNPSAGNPGGAPGINAKRDPDFGPYMAELQRRIKRNWRPPRRNQSKRVVLLFTIARDGRLLNLRVYKPSGEPDTDRAAISAVQLSAPFKPLPRDFSGSSVDIQFTFDYNVFGVGGRSF